MLAGLLSELILTSAVRNASLCPFRRVAVRELGPTSGLPFMSGAFYPHRSTRAARPSAHRARFCNPLAGKGYEPLLETLLEVLRPGMIAVSVI